MFTDGGNGGNVFWQVGSSATLGTTSAFAGNVLALTSITLDTGATLSCGRALAQNGAVTLQANTISIDSPPCGTMAGGSTGGGTPVDEPASALMLGAGLVAMVGCTWNKRAARALLPA